MLSTHVKVGNTTVLIHATMTMSMTTTTITTIRAANSPGLTRSLRVSAFNPQVQVYIGVGDGDKGAHAPKIQEKIFLGNYYAKFGHFSAKNHAKMNFVIFFGKYHKNSGILIIFPATIT